MLWLQRGDVFRFSRYRSDRRWLARRRNRGHIVRRPLLLRRHGIDAQQRQHRPRGFALLRERRFGGRMPKRITGKFLVGGAQQRRRAKPEDQYRHREQDRGEQKTETWEHGGASS